MKKQLLFIALFVVSFINAQSMEFTSAALTTAEVGSTVTVNYKYTSSVSAQVYCAINKYDDTTWSAKVADAFLSPLPAGTDLTGSFDLVIPTNTELTANLTGTFNYKIVIEMKTEDGVDWLAGDYPTTAIDLVASTSPVTNSITITSSIDKVEAGNTFTINFKYTSDNASNYIFCGLNLYDDQTWNSYVGGGEFTKAPAGTDLTGSIVITIPSDTKLTSDLASLQNYKFNIEMKEDVGFNWLAGDYPTTQTAIVAAGSLKIDSFTKGLEEVSLYPNPASESLSILNPKNVNISNIKISNVLGKVVLQRSSLELKESIDISNLSPGIYILSMKNEAVIKNIKFIKK